MEYITIKTDPPPATTPILNQGLVRFLPKNILDNNDCLGGGGGGAGSPNIILEISPCFLTTLEDLESLVFVNSEFLKDDGRKACC